MFFSQLLMLNVFLIPLFIDSESCKLSSLPKFDLLFPPQCILGEVDCIVSCHSHMEVVLPGGNREFGL